LPSELINATKNTSICRLKPSPKIPLSNPKIKQKTVNIATFLMTFFWLFNDLTRETLLKKPTVAEKTAHITMLFIVLSINDLSSRSMTTVIITVFTMIRHSIMCKSIYSYALFFNLYLFNFFPDIKSFIVFGPEEKEGLSVKNSVAVLITEPTSRATSMATSPEASITFFPAFTARFPATVPTAAPTTTPGRPPIAAPTAPETTPVTTLSTQVSTASSTLKFIAPLVTPVVTPLAIAAL
jgi:hypothetical protein